MHRHRRFTRPRVLLAILGLLFLGVTPLASAADPATSQAVTQTYASEGTLQQGMIVRFADKKPGTVAALEADRLQDMYGVVVAANDAALTLSDGSLQRAVYVASLGRYQVLVSNQNGAIKEGDSISVSAIDGVGMKATGQQSVILGRAVDSFNGTGNVVGSTSLKDKSGKSVTVSLSRIAVDLTVGHNPNFAEENESGALGFLKSFSNGIAGKTVNAQRLYLAMAILLISAVVAGSLLYGGIRSAILAVGRNPLAKKSILKGLFQVVLTSLAVFIIGLFGVYLLLKL
jgi:hypothetical protein